MHCTGCGWDDQTYQHRAICGVSPPARVRTPRKRPRPPPEAGRAVSLDDLEAALADLWQRADRERQDLLAVGLEEGSVPVLHLMRVEQHVARALDALERARADVALERADPR